MLEIKNASLHYAKKLIFEGLNFSVRQGEWLAIMGHSGVGKTSLLRLIAGLSRARPEAQTQIDGEVLWQGNTQFEVAYMAQQDGLFPWLSALDNVLLPDYLSGRKAQVQEAEFLLKSVHLEEVESKKPQALSGGMRQRVALARTLIQHTPLVLMDEPFSALDAMTRMAMQDLSFDLLADKTVVMVTHDPWEALRLADSILILDGSPAKIKARMELPATEYTVRDITSSHMMTHYQELMRLVVSD